MSNAIITFLRRPVASSLGGFSNTGLIGKALTMGKAEAGETRIKLMSTIWPLLQEAFEGQSNRAAATVSALEKQIVAAKAPVEVTARALAFCHADESNPEAYLPLFFSLGLVSVANAAELGYTASEFEERVRVPKDWKAPVAQA